MDALAQVIDIVALLKAKQVIVNHLFLTPPPLFLSDPPSKNGPRKIDFPLSLLGGISSNTGFFIKKMIEKAEVFFGKDGVRGW